MKFNKMIPELTVSDINKTKEFYLNILDFKLEYEREADRFIFLSFEETQLMFEEMHENGWNVAEMSYPFGEDSSKALSITRSVTSVMHFPLKVRILAKFLQTLRKSGLYSSGRFTSPLM